MTAIDMARMPHAINQITHNAEGINKKRDPKTGYVTISLGLMNSLSGSPMTMSFKVKDQTLIPKLAVDKKVTFEFIKEGDDDVVTRVP